MNTEALLANTLAILEVSENRPIWRKSTRREIGVSQTMDVGNG
jgi:hypothetical protein